MQTIRQPAPPKRLRTFRLTPKLKALPIDPDTGIKLAPETARCLREYGVNHGWKVVQKRDGDHVIIWRVG